MADANNEAQNANQRWNVNEIAFVKFARYKGASLDHIAGALDRTNKGVAQMSHKIISWEKGRLNQNSHTGRLIGKAMVLEMKVRGGALPEMRDNWLKRLSKHTNIAYSQMTQDPEPVERITIPLADLPAKTVGQTVTTPPAPTVAPAPTPQVEKEPHHLQEVLRLSVTVNLKGISNIANALKDLFKEPS